MSKEYVFALHNQIEGSRIQLRPIQLSDAEDMYEYASDEETTKYVFETHKSLEDTKENIAKYFIMSPLGKYAIVLKEKHKLIGTIDLRVDAEDKKAEIGYTLNKAYWGKGYTTEAGKLMLQLGFKELQLQRIFAFHDERNPASGRVMEKLGMTYEGTFRSNRFVKGETVTDKCYSILKEEYFSN
ncbi:GNAT family N-acetyltransferase [Desemzia sp. RIT804]|uniref:GNAT family N-acetyltransferase n=1 Tax=Desemzia sp. RIT 804 TaxID=2810209 RepID=UPI001950754F|nr:GNAT family N-acetyltransferase [Desemzia sp. RIT 804]MBM6616015.1 GNAT family N-acetyltransferase [Desemzia sp. RIT 804]